MRGRSETPFAFGENWRRFLTGLSEERVRGAEQSLTEALGDLHGLSFLDVGCGSGLYSLAAYRLGAERVHSLDVDPASVGCTQELRSRYATSADSWTVEPASLLDRTRLESLGEWDVVYAWGVLHHTGQMWAALQDVCEMVAPDGVLFISLYNDQGRASRMWRRVKWLHNRLPTPLRPGLVAVIATRFILSQWFWDVVHGRNPLARQDRPRGMSTWTDWVDWVGGYPFEVARPDEVFRFLRDRGFTMRDMRCGIGWGCNEYVARRSGVTASDGGA